MLFRSDLVLLTAATGVALLLRWGGYPMAPLLLGFILGGLLEDNLRRTLMLSQGDPSYFADRPLFLSLGLFTLALVCWPSGRFLLSQMQRRAQA